VSTLKIVLKPADAYSLPIRKKSLLREAFGQAFGQMYVAACREDGESPKGVVRESPPSVDERKAGIATGILHLSKAEVSLIAGATEN